MENENLVFNFSDEYFSNHPQIETFLDLKLTNSDNDLAGVIKSSMNTGSFHII